jgi:transposase
MTATTRCDEFIANLKTLFMALELGGTTWIVACAPGRGSSPRVRSIPARDLTRLWEEIARAKVRFGLRPDAPVRSCYEAGRDGFWIHWALCAHGVHNVIVDPSSITVDRRARRAKSDRIDGRALLTQLMNAAAGDRRGWREIRVPSREAEADRHLQREWTTIQADRNRIRNRIAGLLATQGVRLRVTRGFGKQLAAVRVWDGSLLPAALVLRLEREWTQWQAVEDRLAVVRRLRRARVQRDDVVGVQTRTLARLRGIGLTGAHTLSTELFAWRGFTNGRQIGSCVGLTPTPYRSDQHMTEQGISRSGNTRVRALSIELAWAWLRYQRDSQLARWFTSRFGQHRRARRIGIVAVARKLLIALWRYLHAGVLPEGALLKV